jgi:hypothetical protein
MAGITFTAQGTTKDGKEAKVEVILKSFCKCKKPNCEELAKQYAEEKYKQVLKEFESSQLFWLENQVNPNLVLRLMEKTTEVLEAVCLTVRSNHLQGAQVKVELVGAEVK